MSFPTSRFLLLPLLLTATAFGATGAFAQGDCEGPCPPAQNPPPDYSTARPVSDDLYKVIARGLPFTCDAKDCTIKAKISVSAAAARYLGLSSRTLASGSPDAPTTVVIGERRQHDIRLMKLPASFARKVKAKHVVAMKLKVKLTAEFAEPDAPGGRWHSSYPDPDDLSDLQLGQGSRYGCAPKAGGAIIIGYLHFGGKCPR